MLLLDGGRAKPRRMIAITTLDGTAARPLNSAVTESLRKLELTIASRGTAEVDKSYVATLNAGGIPLIARKFGEEAVEAIVAALSQDKAALISEAADVLFHLLVLLGARGITLDDVEAELVRREGTSGIAEKAARDA